MDNRINDKDLAFVTGGSAATPELDFVLRQLRMAEGLFTNDMPESARKSISALAREIENGLTSTSIFQGNIRFVIEKINTFRSTIMDNEDKLLVVDEILYHLKSALNNLN